MKKKANLVLSKFSGNKRRPIVFLGSASESKDVFRDIRNAIQEFAILEAWPDAVKRADGRLTVDQILQAITAVDFGLFVFDGVDFMRSRNASSLAVRDNVMLEFGVCCGLLGLERTHAIVSESKDGNEKTKIPSDLFGLSLPRFERSQSTPQQVDSLHIAIDEIRHSVERLGFSEILWPTSSVVGFEVDKASVKNGRVSVTVPQSTFHAQRHLLCGTWGLAVTAIWAADHSPVEDAAPFGCTPVAWFDGPIENPTGYTFHVTVPTSIGAGQNGKIYMYLVRVHPDERSIEGASLRALKASGCKVIRRFVSESIRLKA